MNAEALALFAEALDLPVGEREPLVRRRANADPILLAATLALLRADGEASPLDQNLSAMMPTLLDPEAPSLAGAVFGPFVIERMLGRGGMGSVWLAARSGEFEQQVAIKLLSAVSPSLEAQSRFLRERQILARLKHPFIAHLIDGGSYQGTLWFAMEYVSGETLDHYAATPRGLNELIALTIDIASAVQFAHQHLIVHRDLKPTNVMIAGGKPKLLDFGVAKLLDTEAELTATHAPMSLGYAAPEQIQHGVVTTATDIYSLGVMLYELLTGKRPHQGEAGMALLQAIADSDPLPPSRVATAFPSRRLRGDLDTIVMTCLKRDPARRYGSAQALIDDLRAFTEHRPIQARPESWRYRSLKFVRRNPLLVGVASIGLIGVFGASGVALLQARRADAAAMQSALDAENARIEARQADAVSSHLTSVLARAQGQGASVSTSDLLDWASDAQLSGRYGDPAMNRALQLAISEILLQGNNFARALEVLDALQPELGKSARERLQANSNRTRALIRLGKLAEAETALAQARADLPTDPVVAHAQLAIYESEIKRSQGDHAAAAAACIRAGEFAQRLKVSPSTRGLLMGNVGIGLLQVGELDSAILWSERALQEWQTGGVSGLQDMGSVRVVAANARFMRGHISDAIERYREIDESAPANESIPPRAARATGFAKSLAFVGNNDALPMMERARAQMCTATGASSLDCTTMALAAADVAQIVGDDAAVMHYLGMARKGLEARPIPALVDALERFALRAEAMRAPEPANIEALIDRLIASANGSMAQRNAVRGLLVAAQQFQASGKKTPAQAVARAAIDLSKKLPAEDGGMDQGLLALWRARLEGAKASDGTIEVLRRALGPEHPWVVGAR